MRLILTLSAFAVAAAASAQINVVPNTEFLVDFNGLPAEGTPPTFTNNSGSNVGIYVARTGSGTTIIPGSGTATGGGLYSFGTGNATDRAIGTVGSGTAGNFALFVAFRNNGTVPLLNPQISFTAEQWRNSGNTTAQTIHFSYIVAAAQPNLTASDAGASNTGTEGFTALPAGDATTPIASATAGALDGNLAVNQVNVSFALTGVTIPVGESIYLRWNDSNHPGNDHALAIDNLRFQAVPEPASMAVLGLGLAAMKRRRARKS